MSTATKLAVLGGGSWGTALAMVLAPRYARVTLWTYEPELAAEMAATRENKVFLPGFRLPPNVEISSSLEETLGGATTVLGVMPSTHVRQVWTDAKPHLPAGAPIVSATKGIERGTQKRMSEVIREVTGREDVAILSGPSFAREVARGEPTLVVIAAADKTLAERVQKEFAGPTFRPYISLDPVGAEVGAALKNVIAIAAGLCHGLGLGSNAMAALITRGLAEITRLAVSMGAEASTLAGLAGLVDLILTSTGELSRNRRVGTELAKGKNLEEITGSMRMVAEGVENTYSAVELARRQGVEMPIAETLYAIFEHGKSPHDGLRELMERPAGTEV
jgi:glycerol-3-phosphate dehydrogenase (NAD(P)+)